MRYYSDRLNELFDTEEALLKAEEELARVERNKKAEEERKKREKDLRFKEVETAYIDMKKSQNHFASLRDKFLEDYGYLKLTFKDF